MDLSCYSPQRILKLLFVVVLLSQHSRQEDDDPRGNEQEAGNRADGDADHQGL